MNLWAKTERKIKVKEMLKSKAEGRKKSKDKNTKPTRVLDSERADAFAIG